MRFREIISENAAEGMPQDLIAALIDWQSYADHDATWSGARHSWQNQLIAFMRGKEPKLPGNLYRSSMIDDEAARRLLAGQSATLEPSRSLLESWSKSVGHAGGYLDIDGEVSAVLMQVPASRLPVVFDCDDLEPVSPHFEASEVLVRVEPRLLSGVGAPHQAVPFAEAVPVTQRGNGIPASSTISASFTIMAMSG